MDRVEEINITIDMNDSIESIHGVGGSEFVYKKIIDKIKLGNLYNRKKVFFIIKFEKVYI